MFSSYYFQPSQTLNPKLQTTTPQIYLLPWFLATTNYFLPTQTSNFKLQTSNLKLNCPNLFTTNYLLKPQTSNFFKLRNLISYVQSSPLVTLPTTKKPNNNKVMPCHPWLVHWWNNRHNHHGKPLYPTGNLHICLHP